MGLFDWLLGAPAWVKWGGGDCPVPIDSITEARMADGGVFSGRAGDMCWSRGADTDIVAYRVISLGGGKTSRELGFASDAQRRLVDSMVREMDRQDYLRDARRIAEEIYRSRR